MCVFLDIFGVMQGDEGVSVTRLFESMGDEELLIWLTEIFVAADSDNNGVCVYVCVHFRCVRACMQAHPHTIK